MIITLDALLAEIRAAGEPPATIGARLSSEQITHLLRSGMYVGGGWAPAAECAIRQLCADRARLAAEVERLQRSELELVRAARAFSRIYNPCDMPEDDSRQWQVLFDACLRSGVAPDAR